MSKNTDENKSLVQNLEMLGLTAKEASVYLALLPGEGVGSSKIIQSTGLHGQFVYTALESLEKKNLVFHAIQNGRKKFTAASPKRILNLIQNQVLIADEIVQKLEKLTKPKEQQRFEIYQGDQAYVDHEFEQLRSASVGSTLCIIGGQDDRFAQLIGWRKEEYERQRAQKKIRIKYIGSEVQKSELSDTRKRRPTFDYRIIPDFFAGRVNTDIWEDSISFNLFGEPTLVFNLKNRDIADSYQKFFDAIWNIGKE